MSIASHHRDAIHASRCEASASASERHATCPQCGADHVAERGFEHSACAKCSDAAYRQRMAELQALHATTPARIEATPARIERRWCVTSERVRGFLSGLTGSDAILNGTPIESQLDLADINASRATLGLSPIVVR